jgi:hypothetical protein
MVPIHPKSDDHLKTTPTKRLAFFTASFTVKKWPFLVRRSYLSSPSYQRKPERESSNQVKTIGKGRSLSASPKGEELPGGPMPLSRSRGIIGHFPFQFLLLESYPIELSAASPSGVP